MFSILRKVKTGLDYIAIGARLGANLRSKLLLASMLPRLKWQAAHGVSDSKVYAAEIRLGGCKQTLHLRTQDIFIFQEIFGQTPYIFPSIREDEPHCIVDLGAHIGLATLQFKAFFPKATIHCYEPDPENFRLLKMNTEGLDGIVLHQQAVGAVSGESAFYIRPQRRAASSLQRSSQNETVVEVRCVTHSLDDILSCIGIVDLIKFDIEGVEYEVFSRSTLVHAVKHIVGEMKTRIKDLTDFLALFPYHEAHVRNITSNMHIIHLKRVSSSQLC